MSSLSVTIRPEKPSDFAAIHHVNQAAFGQPNEADLIDALRKDNQVALSLVALEDNRIIGHILFCSITIEGEDGVFPALSLSPMAVLPEFQKRGIGSDLVRCGLKHMHKNGHKVVTVLGHPDFYPRFGFRPAEEFNIKCPYDVPSEAFMLIELTKGVLTGRSGTVIYPRAFENV